MRAWWLLGLSALVACSSNRAGSTSSASGSGGMAGSGGGSSDAGSTDAGDAGDGAEAGPPPNCSASPSAWTVAAMSNVGRYSPGVAVLPSGKVLVAGGWDGTQEVVQSSSLLFDPTTNMVTPSSNLTPARNFIAVAPIPTGFLFAGGFNDGFGSESAANVYGVAKGAFAKTGSMTYARELFSATALPDARVVVFGGLSAIGLTVRDTAEIYDPTKGTWSAGGTLLYPRFGQVTLYVPAVGKVFVVGGKTTGPGGDMFIPQAEWWDPTTHAFTAAGSLTTARDRATADFLPDGRILVAGGSNATDGTLTSTEIFDPATSTFTPGPSMITRRMAHTATPLGDGRIVMVGGWSDSTKPSASTNATEVFNPTTMTFTALPPLNAARHDHAAPRIDGCGVLVAGGTQVVQGGATVTPLQIERIDLGAM